MLAGTGCFQGAPCLVIATLLAALAAENGEVLVLTRVEIDMGEKKNWPDRTGCATLFASTVASS